MLAPQMMFLMASFHAVAHVCSVLYNVLRLQLTSFVKGL